MRTLEAHLHQEVYSLLYIHFVLLDVSSVVKCICIYFFQNVPGAERTTANGTEVPQSGARQKVEFWGRWGGGVGHNATIKFLKPRLFT